jgi:hypothetical protein
VRSFSAAGGFINPQAAIPDPRGKTRVFFPDGHPGNQPFRAFPVRKSGIIQWCFPVHPYSSFSFGFVININFQADSKSTLFFLDDVSVPGHMISGVF